MMFLIKKDENKIEHMNERKFSDLGFKERAHLQKWISGYPRALGEDLLIIQEEYSGFNGTNERPDLLAVDKSGNLVVIENKLDDSGRDVTWQAIKYASYCSTLSTQKIIDIYQEYLDKKIKKETAKVNLENFIVNNEESIGLNLNKENTLKIILVAKEFRKEVTSSVLWLIGYGLNIKCIKVIPYELDDKQFVSFEEILPGKENAEYMISCPEKKQDEAAQTDKLAMMRQQFWVKLLERINKSKMELFKGISPLKEYWIAKNINNIQYQFGASGKSVSASINMYTDNDKWNKDVYDELFMQKDIIENLSETKVIHWDRRDKLKGCSILIKKENYNVYHEDDWDDIINFLVDAMVFLEKVFREPVKKAIVNIKNR